MNEKKYKQAMDHIKTSSNFNERTKKLLSNNTVKKEKYQKIIKFRYGYGILVACLLLVFFIPMAFNNSQIELTNSTGNVKVKYVNRFPNISSSNNLVWLSEEEIFNERNTSIFKGEILDIKNIKIDMGGRYKHYRSIVSIKLIESYRGNERVGDVIKILMPGPINMDIWVEDTEVVSSMRVGDKGIFMPIKYDETHIYRENDSTLYLTDISEYGFMDGERYAFIEKENEIIYAKWAFESISKPMSLEDIEEYILDMIK